MPLVPSLGFRGLGFLFRVQGFGVPCSRFSVPGFEFGLFEASNYELGTRNTEHLELLVSGLGFGVHCFRVRVRLI